MLTPVPETDVWIDTQTLEPHNVEFENDLFRLNDGCAGAEVTSDDETELVFLHYLGFLGDHWS